MKTFLAFIFLALSIFPASAQTTVTCGHVDDTAALQAAIDAGPTTVIGHCLICPINLTNRTPNFHGIGGVFTDFSPKATCPISSTNSASIWPTTSGHLFDFTGSYLGNIGDFSVGWFPDTSADVTITDAFFVAQAVSPTANIMSFRNIFGKGKFRATGFYIYGVASGSIDNVQISNFNPGASTYSTAIYITGPNGWGLTSQFAEVGTADSGAPLWNIGNSSEFHMFPGVPGAQACAMWLNGVNAINIRGTNFSAGGVSYICTTGNVSRILIDGAQFGPEASGGSNPSYVFNVMSGSLSVVSLGSTNDYTGATIYGGSGSHP